MCIYTHIYIYINIYVYEPGFGSWGNRIPVHTYICKYIYIYLCV